MEFLTGVLQKETMEISDLVRPGLEGSEVKVNGAIHTIRDMGPIAFVILRKREGLLQCVYEPGAADFSLKDLKEADTIEVSGTLALSEKAPSGIEVRMKSVRILSEPTEAMPIPVSKWKMNVSLETNLDLRPISLRNIRERAKFRIQEGIVRGFRDFLTAQGFTEIHTPKIGSKGAEGGANIFKLDYFHRPAVLAQSPQFYKQMMVGVFDRVFETAPVFRAEKHNTKRHLNEYTSLDFEMGYIDGFEDIMAMETGALQNIMKLLEKEYQRELKLLGTELPRVDKIPCVRFDEAKRLVSEKYDRPIKNPYDLEPEDIRFSPGHLAALIAMVDRKEINGKIAKDIFEVMYDRDVDPEAYAEEKGLKTVNDEGLLRSTIEKIVEDNPQSVEDYHSGKEKAIGFLVGQTMKAMKGKADPAMVNVILKEIL